MENYKLIKQIGEGSYGKVQLAVASDGKQVVIKVIDTRRMNVKERKSSMNEVKVLSSLKHPYIVRYYDSFLSGGKLNIVMAFAENGDLYSRIKKARKGSPIPTYQVLEWFTQATLALKYLHDLRILHRDLKTQNMFLTSEERLKIGDFGISRVLASTSAFARTMIGTPYYMSPEVCSERPYSLQSDIWALGCVLFELYELRVPFEAASIRDLMQKIIRANIPRALKACPSGQQLCADMMARNPSNRPTAAQVLERPLIQEQIRAMLKKNHGSTAGEVPPACAPPSGPAEPRVLQARAPSPYGQQRRSPSPAPGWNRAPSPNLPARAASPLRRGGAYQPPASPRVQPGVLGLPPKGVPREPSAPVLLNGMQRGLAHVPQSPRGPYPQSPRGPPRAASPSPRLYAPSPPRQRREYSPAPNRLDHDPNDWYQKALGILR